MCLYSEGVEPPCYRNKSERAKHYIKKVLEGCGRLNSGTVSMLPATFLFAKGNKVIMFNLGTANASLLSDPNPFRRLRFLFSEKI